MNPQETLDALRWQWTGGKNIEVERDFLMPLQKNW